MKEPTILITISLEVTSKEYNILRQIDCALEKLKTTHMGFAILPVKKFL
jgi:hypothetical protein